MPSKQTIFPALRYGDADTAIEWLGAAFGFEPHAVHRGPQERVVHAELRLGDGVIMLSEEGEDDGRGFGLHAGQGWLYVVVDDPDSQFERARAAGAKIVRGLEDTDYGSRDFSVRDPEGNLWSFGTYGPTL